MEICELREKAKEIASACGFSQVNNLAADTLVFMPEVRDMCAANTCGRYDKCWSCPPGCGTLDECAAQAAKYSWGILVQTVGELEDSMDFETMAETEEQHRDSFLATAEKLRELFPGMLPLGAGTCMICKECTYPDKPCRFPEKRISSMEAYGLLVSDVCTKNNTKYYYGPNTIAYTACFLLG